MKTEQVMLAPGALRSGAALYVVCQVQRRGDHPKGNGAGQEHCYGTAAHFRVVKIGSLF
jgi:hypothetical protein